MALDDGKVSADYLKQAAERIRSLKELSYERMAIRPGNLVLDVGCGPGMDTVPLAARVGAQGGVIGIDCDPAMLQEADQHALQHGVAERITHLLGSALDLPLAANHVDSCRAERLLQVLPVEAEHKVVSELIRVTSPAGRIVLIDADWGSASVDFSDVELERRLMHFFATQMRPNGFAGRKLYALCRDGGLKNISVETISVVHNNFEETPFGKWLIDTAVREKIIDSNEAMRWHNELTERSAAANFYASVNMVVVTANKP